MSTATAIDTDNASVTTSPAAGWTRTGRLAAAVSLVAGGLCWTAGDLIGFGKDGVDELQYMRDHPGLTAIGQTGDLLGTVFLLGAVLAWLLLSRRRSGKLAWVGAGMLAFGLVAQAVVSGIEISEAMLVHSGAIPLKAIDSATSSPTSAGLVGYVFMPMWFIGAFAGIVALMVALWRSRTVPRPAITLVIAFQVVQFIGVVPGTPLLLIGLVWMAIAIARSGGGRPVQRPVVL